VQWFPNFPTVNVDDVSKFMGALFGVTDPIASALREV